MANQIDAIKEIDKELKKLETTLKDIRGQIIGVSKDVREASSSFNDIKTPKGLSEEIKKTASGTEKMNALMKEQDKLEKQLISTTAKYKLATESTNRALIKTRFELNQQNRLVKEAAVLSSRLSSELQKASVVRNRLARTIQDLNLKKELGITLTKAETIELNKATIAFKKYDAAIRRSKESVGRFQENVGNYPKGLMAAASAARSLGSALGFMGGAFLIVNTVRDAINRIREFDKTMQNLSGILRTSRSEIKDLENEIISVAKSSVRTTNEISKLAESLITLGKTKDEVKDLISPVTDLSLALDASADEAGEFLVQMLNTFGASTSEAGKYADTIATIRTSTSLDFQRMRDSFQYLAPISRALNKDLAYTGSLIGILSDNGIKAERAGRLLGTAQQKLASEGKSLTDALDELNKASKNNVSELDLLKLASELFGKQAAALGVILANNTDEIDKNAEAIRNNGGALKDLVNEQLESLDAKLKLLDSAWEGLITTIDNGQGKMSTYIKDSVSLFTGLLTALTEVEKASEGLSKAGVNEGFLDYLKRLHPALLLIESDYDKAEKAQLSFDKMNQRLSKTTLELVEAEKQSLISKFNNKDASEEERKVYLQQIRVLEQAIKTKKQEREDTIKQAKELGYLGQAYTSTGKVLENFYDNAEQATTKELKMFIAAQKAKKKALDNDNDGDDDDKNEKRNKATSLAIKLEKERETNLKVAEETIKRLLELYKDDSSFELPEIDQQSLDKFSEQISKAVFADKTKEDAAKRIRDGISELFGTMQDVLGVNASVFDTFFDRITEKGEKSFDQIADIAASSFDVIGELGNALFEGRIQKYEEDIEANNEYYANLLENENLTDEERKRLEQDRRNEEKRLKKEQEKEEKKAFLFNQALAIADIGINLAKTISAINLAAAAQDAITPFAFGATGAAFRASNLPLAIASAAVQTGVVLAKTLPAFAEGGKMDHDGLMMINDHKSGRLEVVERNGKLLMTDKRNAIVEGKKGDIIHKDAKDYFNNLSDKQILEDVNNHAIIATLQQQNYLLNKFDNKKVIDNERMHTEMIVKAIKSKKSRFVLNQNISLAEDLKYLSRLNNTL